MSYYDDELLEFEVEENIANYVDELREFESQEDLASIPPPPRNRHDVSRQPIFEDELGEYLASIPSPPRNWGYVRRVPIESTRNDELLEFELQEYLSSIPSPPPNLRYLRRVPMGYNYDDEVLEFELQEHLASIPSYEYDLLGGDDSELLALAEGMPDLSSSIEDSVFLPGVQEDSVFLPQSIAIPPAPTAHVSTERTVTRTLSLSRIIPVSRRVSVIMPSPAIPVLTSPLRSEIPPPTSPPLSPRHTVQQFATSSPISPALAATGWTDQLTPVFSPAMIPSWKQKHRTNFEEIRRQLELDNERKKLYAKLRKIDEEWGKVQELRRQLNEEMATSRVVGLNASPAITPEGTPDQPITPGQPSGIRRRLESDIELKKLYAKLRKTDEEWEKVQELRRQLNEEKAASRAAGMYASSEITPERTLGQPMAAVSSRIRVPLTPGVGSITTTTFHESAPTPMIPSTSRAALSTPRRPVRIANAKPVIASTIPSPIPSASSSIMDSSFSSDSSVPADVVYEPNIQLMSSPETPSPRRVFQIPRTCPFGSGSSGSIRGLSSSLGSDDSIFRVVVDDPYMYPDAGYIDFSRRQDVLITPGFPMLPRRVSAAASRIPTRRTPYTPFSGAARASRLSQPGSASRIPTRFTPSAERAPIPPASRAAARSLSLPAPRTSRARPTVINRMPLPQSSRGLRTYRTYNAPGLSTSRRRRDRIQQPTDKLQPWRF